MKTVVVVTINGEKFTTEYPKNKKGDNDVLVYLTAIKNTHTSAAYFTGLPDIKKCEAKIAEYTYVYGKADLRYSYMRKLRKFQSDRYDFLKKNKELTQPTLNILITSIQ